MYEIRVNRTHNILELSAFQAHYVMMRFHIAVVACGVFPELDLPDDPRFFEDI